MVSVIVDNMYSIRFVRDFGILLKILVSCSQIMCMNFLENALSFFVLYLSNCVIVKPSHNQRFYLCRVRAHNEFTDVSKYQICFPLVVSGEQTWPII